MADLNLDTVTETARDAFYITVGAGVHVGEGLFEAVPRVAECVVARGGVDAVALHPGLGLMEEREHLVLVGHRSER